jgi:hypothetical protein
MADNGVQMPGPQGSGYEDGFNAIGQDFRDLAPRGGNSAGMDLPHGNAESEAGWKDGQDYSGLASQDFVDTTVGQGVFSDDAAMVGDVASSAGFRIIDSFEGLWGNSGGSQAAPQGEQHNFSTGGAGDGDMD